MEVAVEFHEAAENSEVLKVLVTAERSEHAGEVARGEPLALYERGLLSIQEASEAGLKPALVLSAVGRWLELVVQVYADQPNEIGWSWFLNDYCPDYADAEARGELQSR